MQHKKLEDSKNKLEQHLEKRESLKNSGDKKELEKVEKYIGIWSKNIAKIEKEIKKIEDREK